MDIFYDKPQMPCFLFQAQSPQWKSTDCCGRKFLHFLYIQADYHIEIHKPKGVQKGVRWIEVDGERINGNQIPKVNGRNEYHVIVQMG